MAKTNKKTREIYPHDIISESRSKINENFETLFGSDDYNNFKMSNPVFIIMKTPLTFFDV